MFIFRTLLPLLALTLRLEAAPTALFDGRTFEGWEGETGKVWRIAEGTVVGGSAEGNPRNEFLATRKVWRNFRLTLEYRLTGTEGFVNGGVQFRSRRAEDPAHEMIGYQADIGAGYSGALYDESRRKVMLAKPEEALIRKLEKPGGWNHYEIRAVEENIRIYLNGVRTVNYTEPEAGIDMEGQIALQIHGQCKAVIEFRNISLEELPDSLLPEPEEILDRFGGAGVPAAPAGGFADGKFAVTDHEVIVLAGQANLVREQKSGDLEAVLSLALPGKSPRFRSMAWEGDTVYEQWRDLNFGDWKAQLDTAGAGIVMAQFGQVEAMDGTGRLAEFSAAYHRLLDQFQSRTGKLVLLSPMPFEQPPEPHAPDLRSRNTDVAAYAEAVREIARQRGVIYVDLFTPLSRRNPVMEQLADNGMHLNAAGLRAVAELTAEGLGLTPGGREPPAALLEAIVEKNRLWFDCWRPANWSFVYGDRISQPFGKAAPDATSLRVALESYLPRIAAQEARIHQMARGEQPDPPAAPDRIEANQPGEPMAPPETQLAGFRVADGYEVNLFASEAIGVVKPVQISWDERGRLYVACSPTYPHTIPGRKPQDYILVLEDTDHDGRADRQTRFAEGLTMVQGVEPGDGGVYVCDFDQLLHFSDSDGDGIADAKRVIFSGFGIGDTHQLVNSISHGPDGSLWFTQGLHAFSRVETVHGLAVLERAGIWRYQPRTGKLESFFNGGMAGHNCWGVAFDDYNQMFHKSGDRPAGYFSTPGLIPLRNPEDYHPVGAIFDTSPKTTSLEIIGTKAMPDNIQGCALIGGYFGGVVELHRFEDDGAGFKTTQLPRLITSPDPAFRPVDVSQGPDGALYVCDWTNPVIGHYQASYADPERDRSHGRIWRITAKGIPPVRPENLGVMTNAELLARLGSPERWTRYQAKRLLFDRPSTEVLAACDAFLTEVTEEPILMELCGVYEAHRSPRPALLERLRHAEDGRIRAYAARVTGAWADQLPDPLTKLSLAVRDPFPRVRLEAVVACARIPGSEAILTALGILDHPADKFINYALRQAVRARQPDWAGALKALEGGGDRAAWTWLTALTGEVPVPDPPGKVIYDTLCLNCHQPDGKGLAGVYPGLAASDWVSGRPERLVKVLLHGLSGPISVNGEPFRQVAPLPMPPMGLDDRQIQDVTTWLRSHFDNNAEPVPLDLIRQVREGTAGRSGFWTEEELRDR